MSTYRLNLVVRVAPHSVAQALSGVAGADYCPLHSLMGALSFSRTNDGAKFGGSIAQLTVDAYGLPLPPPAAASNCVIPDCSTTGPYVGGCRNIFLFPRMQWPIEPVVLQRAMMRWGSLR